MTLSETQIVESPGCLSSLPRTSFLAWPTPIERLERLGESLGIELLVKRDDLTGLAFGGNKVRQLEFYFGQALAEKADTILITGAVQSNYVRVAAACAARLGMDCHIQLEDRVPNVDAVYRASGNVLVSQLLGAKFHSYPLGEDEDGADQRLEEIAVDLKARGRHPFIVPLSSKHPPTGALGYVNCAGEVLSQQQGLEHIVVASGSGHTHSGLLVGLRAHGWRGSVHGICVRRAASAQQARIVGHSEKLEQMLGIAAQVRLSDVLVHDDVLAPGYGVMNDAVADAIDRGARLEGLMLDPVYTGRAMAGLIECTRDGRLPGGSRVLFIHTGGLPALFAYTAELQRTGLIGMA